MTAKVRTQLQLERRQYLRLKRLAYERQQSLSAVVRELLDQALSSGAQPPSLVREVRLAMIGAGRDVEGRRDVGRRHDEYLYGRKR